jgi:hypothetical protein
VGGREVAAHEGGENGGGQLAGGRRSLLRMDPPPESLGLAKIINLYAK